MVDKKKQSDSSSHKSHANQDYEQLNLRIPEKEAQRFRVMADANRYKLGAFLCVLMDAYESNKNKK